MAAAGLDPERDFERLRPPARRRFLARARRAGQDGQLDLDAAADDAYQEAWLELQRRPDAVAIEHDPAGYLAGIMWHRFHREELRPARVETAPLDDDGEVGGPEPDTVVELRETLATVRDALAALPARERTALLLRAEGFGHDDIAATLGVSRRIARKLAERGRSHLTEELEAGDRCASIASTLRAIGLGWPVRGDRRARLDDHLAHCVTCRATVVTLREEGSLAAGPAVLAGHGALTRLLEALTASLSTKVAVGGVAASVCVVGVVEITPPTRRDPAPTPIVVAQAPVKVKAPPPVAPDVQDRTVSVRRTQRAERRQEAKQRVAVQRARAAAKRAQTAAAQARAGAQQARAGAQQARAGAERARAGAQTATEAGQTAAQRGVEAGERGREAADRVRDALAGIGG